MVVVVVVVGGRVNPFPRHGISFVFDDKPARKPTTKTTENETNNKNYYKYCY